MERRRPTSHVAVPAAARKKTAAQPAPASSASLAEFYRSESERIADLFHASSDGRSVVRQRTELVTKVILRLWENLFAAEAGAKLALAAIGGFGREELFPYSDVDLLFLCEAAPEARAKDKIGALCRELWDMGLRVSPVTRTLAQCDALDPNNIEGLIALLDCRYLAGDSRLFVQLHDTVVPRVVRREWQPLVRALAEVTAARHARHGNTIFHLEPNVKESPGGLRDLHVSRWMALLSALDKQRSWPDAAALFPPALRQSCEAAGDFLFAVRCFLHYRQGRDDNKLEWEAQNEAETRDIGVARRNGGTADWMRTYFQQVRAVHRLTTQMMEDVAPARSSLYRQFQQWRSRVSNQDFSVVGGRVFLQRSSAIHEPDTMLRLFAFVARHGLRLSVDTERRAEQALPSMAARLPRGPACWSHLRDILLAPEAASALRAMHALGLLTRLVPEFKLIDCLVLRDMHHRYTVDEHTFLTIENLHHLPQAATEWERRFAEIHAEAKDLDLLYLSLLLHDLGKGCPGKPHVSASTDLAAGILLKLGLAPRERDTVRFLISNHLEMSAALRRDIFDPATIQALAEKIGTPERLRLLSLLTYTDIKSVHADALTPWKAESLWQLYIATDRHLSRSADQAQDTETDLARLLLVFPDKSEELRSFLAGFPNRYLRTYAEQAAFHFSLASQLPKDRVQLALNLNRDLFELTVVTTDRPGLFATITGVLFAWGMDIVKANAFSNSAGVIVDTFLFRDRFRTLLLNPPEREVFKRSLDLVLSGEESLEKLVERRRKSERSAAPKIKVETRIDFDDESSSHSTVMELIAQDRPGLLYTVSSVLSEQECNIEIALIDTEGQAAIDVFYLTAGGSKLGPGRQKKLAEELGEALDAPA
ncbi:MAG: [protein-PII] uridylyltransferase [Terriglobales bacterium]